MASPGQWAGGFRAWDEHGVYFATGRGAEPGPGAPAARRRRCGDLSQRWFPFGVHFIEGLVNTVRRIESTARQREALVALGTLAAGLAHEINNPASAGDPRRRRAAGDRQRDAAGLAGAARAQAASPPSSSSRSTRCGAALGGAVRRRLARRSPTARTTLSDWLADHGVDAGLAARPAAGGGRRRRRLVRAGRRPSLGGRRARSRGWSGWPASLSMTDAARRGQGVDRPHLRAGRGGAVLLPARPRVAAARPTSPRAWRARW